MADQLPIAKQEEIAKLVKEGLSYREIGKRLGVHFSVCQKYKNGPVPGTANSQPKPENTRTDDVRQNNRTISLSHTRIHSEDALLDEFEVDRAMWEVERWRCVAHEMGMKPPATTEYVKTKDGRTIPTWVRFEKEPVVETLYSCTAWLKRRVEVQRVKQEIEQLKAAALEFAPKWPPAILHMRSKYSSGVWVEHSLVDHHFGALIWGKETGRDDYDLPIARQCWESAIAANCDRTDGFKPEGALFVIGNDQQNADNRAGDTEHGTRQSMDDRYQKVYGINRDATIWATDQFLARYGRVHVVVVGGNHDPLSAFHLGDYLTAWYHNNKRVTVDNSPAFRKFWEHGTVGLMFTHGNTGKLERYPITFAAEAPELWGRTKWHEVHSADKHHRTLIELDGCAVRILPSLRPPCAWSAEQMLGAIRAAESYVWSKTEALIGSATFSVLPKTAQAK